MDHVAEIQRKLTGDLNERMITSTTQSHEEHPRKRSKRIAAVVAERTAPLLPTAPVLSSRTEQMPRRIEDVSIGQRERVDEESSQTSTSEEFLVVSDQVGLFLYSHYIYLVNVRTTAQMTGSISGHCGRYFAKAAPLVHLG